MVSQIIMIVLCLVLPPLAGTCSSTKNDAFPLCSPQLHTPALPAYAPSRHSSVAWKRNALLIPDVGINLILCLLCTCAPPAERDQHQLRSTADDAALRHAMAAFGC